MNTDSKAENAPLAKKVGKSLPGVRISRFQAILTAFLYCLNHNLKKMGFYIGREKASRPREGFIPNPKLRFLDQVSEVMRFKHHSLRTEPAFPSPVPGGGRQRVVPVTFVLFHGTARLIYWTLFVGLTKFTRLPSKVSV